MSISNKNYMPMKPWDSKTEGFCATCQSYTTNYNSHGECSDCGTEVGEFTLDLVEEESK
jgi:hypothetical protein